MTEVTAKESNPNFERSISEILSDLPQSEREEIVANLPPEQVVALQNDWWFQARPKQLPPEGDWLIWLVLAGRGWGKSMSGAMWVHKRGMAGDENRKMVMIGKTPAEVRDIMIEGSGGILPNAPKQERPEYQPSNRRLVWPTGAICLIRSGANPHEMRGFSGDTAWLDELAAWRSPEEVWNNMMLGLREAKVGRPRICVTTTPRPIPLLKRLVEWAGEDPGTVRMVKGSSYENRANLSSAFYDQVVARYEGTSLGAQEIHAELLTEDPNALWDRETIEETRTEEGGWPKDLDEVVVGVDPAGSSAKETGIVVVGRAGDKGYVMADRSMSGSPGAWARRAIDAYHEFKADILVGEKNNGGDMVESTLRTVDEHVAYETVWASRGKKTRAGPIQSLWERRLMAICGHMPQLEDQMATWVPGDRSLESPDRLDAMVWAASRVMLGRRKKLTVGPQIEGFMKNSYWRP